MSTVTGERVESDEHSDAVERKKEFARQSRCFLMTPLHACKPKKRYMPCHGQSFWEVTQWLRSKSEAETWTRGIFSVRGQRENLSYEDLGIRKRKKDGASCGVLSEEAQSMLWLSRLKSNLIGTSKCSMGGIDRTSGLLVVALRCEGLSSMGHES